MQWSCDLCFCMIHKGAVRMLGQGLTGTLLCSGEVLHEGELVAVCIKKMHERVPTEVAEQEIEVLAAARGFPHMIQEVHPSLHDATPGSARIVTRCGCGPRTHLLPR